MGADEKAFSNAHDDTSRFCSDPRCAHFLPTTRSFEFPGFTGILTRRRA